MSLALLSAACGDGTRVGEVEYRIDSSGLRTVAVRPEAGSPILCAAAKVLPFRLEIDLSASNPVWGSSDSTGSTFDILWPPGFELRTTPVAALYDPEGRLIGVDGQLIEDAGGSGGEPSTVCSIGGRDYQLSR